MAYANKVHFIPPMSLKLIFSLGVWLVFDLFVDSIHDVSPQEEVADLWHINELEANNGI